MAGRHPVAPLPPGNPRGRQWQGVVFLILWSLSLGAVLTGDSQGVIWKIAAFGLVAALFVTVRTYLQYRSELQFLREFHHLSQTMDDLRVLDPKNPFSHILETVVRIVGFHRALLLLLDAAGGTLSAVQACNHEESVWTALVVRRADGPCLVWRVIDRGELIAIGEPESSPLLHPRFMKMMQGYRLAMAPIARGGSTYGVLVVDRRKDEQEISDEDLLQLQVLADQISVSLQNQDLHEELSRRARLLEEREVRVQQELALARLVQDGVLPRSKPDWEGLRLYSYIRPARVIGGDFFRYLDGCRTGKDQCRRQACQTCPNHLPGILIGDVSGKGIPAALVMAVVNSLFLEKVNRFSDPARIMVEVNLSLKESLGAESRFHASAFLGFFLRKEEQFVYANAGHDFPLWLDAPGSEAQPLESTGTLLGIFRESEYSNRELPVRSGGRLLFYTDGLVDFLEDAHGQADGFVTLQRMLAESSQNPPEELVFRLQKLVEGPTTEPQDDITAAVVVVD